MKTKVVCCGAAVNKSEVTARRVIEAGLRKAEGSDEWLLLTNLQFTDKKRRPPFEIDIVAIGPPGVRLVEVKHWNDHFIRTHPDVVEQEAARLVDKTKRARSAVREALGCDPRAIHYSIFLTRGESQTKNSARSEFNGVRLHPLKDWDHAIGLWEPKVLTADAVQAAGECLAPSETQAAVSGKLRPVAGNRDLHPLKPVEEQFHRIYKGRREESDESIELHLYDLSAEDGDASTKATRAWDCVRLLAEFSWSPKIVDSYQRVPGYAGELYFFTFADPGSVAVARQAADDKWGSEPRLAFAREAVQALTELHSAYADGEAIVHRNLSPETILVRPDNSPVLTGFQIARIPDASKTVSTAQREDQCGSEYTAPEVRRHGLQAAGQRSDIFSLCKSLSIVFARRQDAMACRALEILDRGTAEEPLDRCDLGSMRDAIDGLLGRPLPLPPAPPAQDWASGQDVSVGGNLYRVRDRVGSGGVGITFQVDKVIRPNEKLIGPYSGKVVPDAAIGPQVLASYEQVRPHARHPLAAVLETAPEWAANNFVAIMRWVEGSTLLDIAGCLEELALELAEPSEEALAHRWLCEVCDGLDALHRNDLCHGDVSPSNLIASERSIVLTDYDCAGRSGEPAMSPGTIDYCAPQSREDSPLSASNDIYALAASFFHALFDREPFRREGDLIKQRGLAWLEDDRSRVPAIAPFLDRATDPDPERRFASASEALAALREISVVPPVEEPAEPEQSPVEGSEARAGSGRTGTRADGPRAGAAVLARLGRGAGLRGCRGPPRMDPLGRRRGARDPSALADELHRDGVPVDPSGNLRNGIREQGSRRRREARDDGSPRQRVLHGEARGDAGPVDGGDGQQSIRVRRMRSGLPGRARLVGRRPVIHPATERPGK